MDTCLELQAAWFCLSILAASLSFTGDVSIPVTLPLPSFRLDSSFIFFFVMLSKAAFVLCMFYIIFIVCSWTLHRLCDLCLSDSLYFFVKYFNKMKLFFTTYCDMLLFSQLWPLLQGQRRLLRQWLSVVCMGGITNIHILIKECKSWINKLDLSMDCTLTARLCLLHTVVDGGWVPPCGQKAYQLNCK